MIGCMLQIDQIIGLHAAKYKIICLPWDHYDEVAVAVRQKSFKDAKRKNGGLILHIY